MLDWLLGMFLPDAPGGGVNGFMLFILQIVVVVVLVLVQVPFQRRARRHAMDAERHAMRAEEHARNAERAAERSRLGSLGGMPPQEP